MSQNPHHLHARPAAGRPQRITSADESRSADMHSRTVKYTVSMSVRLACFIAAFFVHGWLQVVMLVLAVILPYFAVIVANASGTNLDKRSESNYYDHEPVAELGASAQDATQDDDEPHPAPADPAAATDQTDRTGGGAAQGAESEVLPGQWYTSEGPDTAAGRQGTENGSE
ncbi:DUF3099 domain-containing protein [Arthrobacter sp.]|uniref:DUF3099 domain-containing protein n=1 Tax=Arthrobacter sp. TaxID=1667 RepID=UPI003A936637